jgi:hypothetical protein
MRDFALTERETEACQICERITMSSDINMSEPNLDAAKGTYSGFIKFLKRGTVISAIAAVVAVLVIAS